MALLLYGDSYRFPDIYHLTRFLAPDPFRATAGLIEGSGIERASLEEVIPYWDNKEAASQSSAHSATLLAFWSAGSRTGGVESGGDHGQASHQAAATWAA